MSQHFFDTVLNGRPVAVLMGWDRPLQGFFLTVSVPAPADDADDEYLYCNLDDPELLACRGMPKTMVHFKSKLAELGLKVPDLMLREVATDQVMNVGNRYVSYDADGKMKEGSATV